MKCPRCKSEVLKRDEAQIVHRDNSSLTWGRACPCGNTFTTIEKRVSYKHKGVRFDVCIGDDEPGARKP